MIWSFQAQGVGEPSRKILRVGGSTVKSPGNPGGGGGGVGVGDKTGKKYPWRVWIFSGTTQLARVTPQRIE